MNQPLRTALVYDFDGTLAPGSIQEHSFLPSLDIAPAAFWELVNAVAKEGKDPALGRAPTQALRALIEGFRQDAGWG